MQEPRPAAAAAVTAAAGGGAQRSPAAFEKPPQVGVIGLGLIGGSIALAARRRLGARVLGFDADPRAAAAALAVGAVDECRGEIAQVASAADAVFVATPVRFLRECIEQALRHAPVDCLVSDAGSTKRQLVASIADQRFIGGHPLAGSEGSGIRHARAEMFDGATWYLTPTAAASGVLYERLHRMLAAFGALPQAIDAEDHDRMMACVSHLPHVLANVLVERAASAMRDERSLQAGLQSAADGPSFRDATRVAGANGAIWTDIYLSNREELSGCIDGTIAALQEVRALLAGGDRDGIERWNDRARALADELSRGQDGGEPLRQLRVLVPNRPGVVAEIALTLGRAGLNISDMALAPSADNSQGVIALWLRGASATEQASRLIEAGGFTVLD